MQTHNHRLMIQGSLPRNENITMTIPWPPPTSTPLARPRRDVRHLPRARLRSHTLAIRRVLLVPAPPGFRGAASAAVGLGSAALLPSFPGTAAHERVVPLCLPEAHEDEGSNDENPVEVIGQDGTVGGSVVPSEDGVEDAPAAAAVEFGGAALWRGGTGLAGVEMSCVRKGWVGGNDGNSSRRQEERTLTCQTTLATS